MNLSRRNARNDEPEINVTNFIDVLLLLLIFFMLATTFVDEGHINMRLPDASAKVDATASRPTLEISISASGVYAVNGKELINTSTDTLSSAISKVAGDDRKQSVLIRADGRSTHQSVITAMDVLGRLGFTSISMATVNQSASQGSK